MAQERIAMTRWSSGSRIAAAALVALAMSAQAQVSDGASQQQAVAAMQARWAGMLDALERGDVDAAAAFFLPERRPAFFQNARRVDVAQLKAASRGAQMKCTTASDGNGSCDISLPTPAAGSREMDIPFVRRDGVWYLDFE
jgi:hypothetical protein